MSDANDENGEGNDFISLLTSHQSAFRAYITSLMPGSPDVNDVLQETNLALWTKRGKFRAGSNFTAWGFAVARFAVLENRRKTRRKPCLVFNDELLDSIAFAPEDLHASVFDKRRAALESCLAKLTASDLSLIRQRYSRGSSLQSHSLDLGKSAGALRIALFRIRAALRKCINRKLRQSGSPA